MNTADLIVVGAGVAGLTAAITAAENGLGVVVLNKGPRWRVDRAEQPTATYYAQGGVAVVAPDVPEDSVDLHLSDTIAAGAGLTDAGPSEQILSDGWSAVSQLIDWGAEFDRDPDGHLLRTREGGHSVRRIIHSGGDATGSAIQRALGARFGGLLATGLVTCIDDAVVTELIVDDGQVTGVRYRSAGAERMIAATSVLLATGGVGHLYSATTNPAGATADGIALALRAGALVTDLEFIQFHPTMLYVEGARGRRTLVSEAVRGEGGRLVDVDGLSVTAGVHPLGDLAPRDVVANAVQVAMERTGAPFVYLDIRAVDDFTRRFPTVSAGVAASGLEYSAANGMIPVVPGAHYLCGGVITDTATRTGVPGLLAAGEVARTGLHGANRLASNSVLEGLVMGRRAAWTAADRRRDVGAASAPSMGRTMVDQVTAEQVTAPALARTDLQNLMTRYVALRRDGDGLHGVAAALDAAPGRALVETADIEDASLTLAARAVVAAASARRETRGSHHRTDLLLKRNMSSSIPFRFADGAVVDVERAGTMR